MFACDGYHITKITVLQFCKKKGNVMKKIALILAAALAVSALFTGCAKQPTETPVDQNQEIVQDNTATVPVVLPETIVTPEDGTVVLKIGNTDVSYAMLRYYLLAFSRAYGGDDTAVWQNAALNEIMTIGAINQFAEKNNIVLPDAVRDNLNASLLEIINSFEGTEMTYAEALEGDFLTDTVFRDIQENYILRYYIQATQFMENSEFFSVEDQDITDYIHDKYIRVKHILIKTTDLDDAQKAEARNRANTIAEQAANGADFEALVKEYSEDGMDPETGYYFTYNEMVPEFEEASYALEIDQVSGVVESTYGYHIIKKYAMDDTYILENEELRSAALETISTAKFEEALNKELQDISVTYYGEYESATEAILAEAVAPAAE